MFLNQKAYAHSVLAQDAYPRFLRAKAFSNLSPFTSFLRLLFGLLFAWAGLVAAFCFIFLDIQPRRLRVTVRAPPLPFAKQASLETGVADHSSGSRTLP